ncbi:MAG: sodium:solute symporter [Acidobacteria bacterium]|nr:sodium:solute symporter [Acidobacteriota bacterium]MCG2816416.1 sodium:solute symporter [Candidatus Aminicenantes bacterium]MBU1339427.1 sodium:solute symporter [Acidobacteriota bacterium]MBU1473877.1 sodium:solute symporter [Acidobacteriota bacterium]MBU4204224.1 sodium:solute symporter [Acidobacteriota bacterium]
MQVLHTLDWLIIGLYFAVLFGIAFWVLRQKQDTTTDYFLAGRHVGWFVIGASIFASNIGSEHIVGLAGTAAKSGVAMAHYELHAWCVLLLGWVFIPFYMRSRVFTMPEFLEKRYSPAARWFLSIISLVAYVFTKVSVTVYAGAIVFQTLMGIDFWTGALITVVLTGIYTILGGLRAVVYTEALQAIVLILGSLTVTVIGLIKIGGWNKLIALAGSEHLNLFRPLSDPDFPWLGIVLAAPIVGIWYWCTDQYIVQRALAARSESHARRGTIFASYLKLLPFWIFIIPGIIAFALTKTGQLDLASPDQAFPAMVKALLPIGIRGLVIGGLLAALMSSLAAVFNSCSTLFTMDIYKKIRPDASEKRLVFVGRVATAAVVVCGIAWIPLMKFISGELYHYLQSVQSYLAPPITAVFLLGLFWKKINAKGAVSALIGGFIIGMLRLVLELGKEHLSGFLYQFASINFLYFCIFLFLISIAIMVVVSMLTEAPNFEKIRGLTYATTVSKDKAASRASWNTRDLVLSIIVLVIIAAVMIYFSPLVIAK